MPVQRPIPRLGRTIAVTAETAQLAYRPEIDGMRAIAVAAVVLYHYGAPVPGGFAGVDVFFVLSGFLIGTILWREMAETGTIRLSRFFLRRIRRLAPAFFLMAAVVTVVAWAVLLPFEFRDYAKALVAATVYLSNLQFWREAGYFDAAAEDKALLHTWSLAVEEQFYICLPLVLLLLARRPRTLVLLLVALALASFAASVWATARSQPTAFYLFPFRAWELLAGVLLGVWGLSARARWAWHPALSWAGLALVLAGLAVIPAEGFPGWWALLPVAGTVLLLLNGQDANPVNRALSAPGPVWLGRISYALYLWHWPILVLALYRSGGELGWGGLSFWLGVSVALSWASWRFVETPIRFGAKARAPWLLGGWAAGSAALLGVGGAVYLGDGLPARFGPEVRPHIAASADFLQDFSRCRIAEDGPLVGLEICPIGPEGPPEVLVWGDSHLRALHEGLALAAAETETPGLVVWRAGCPPVFGVAKTESAATPAQDAACTVANAQMRAALPKMTSVRDVLLVARWAYYAEGRGAGLDAENRIDLRPAPGSGLGPGTNAEILAAALALTAQEIGETATVHAFRQPPELQGYESRLLARQLAHGRISDAETAAAVATPRATAEARAARADALLAALSAEGRIRVIDPWPRLCDAAACRALHDGAGYYFDTNHLTNTAARTLRDLFLPVFRPNERPVAGDTG